MLTNIYLNVDECWLTSFVPQQRFKLQISLNYGKIEQNVVSWSVLMLKVALTWPWLIQHYQQLKSTNNARHILQAWLDEDLAWLDKD